MKNLYLLFFLLGCVQLGAFAQHPRERLANINPEIREQLLAKYSTPAATDKSMVLKSRIIAARYRAWFGSTWDDRDSLRFVYMGSRGGSTPFSANYDSAYTIVLAGVPWITQNLRIRTYDGTSNRVASQTEFVYTSGTLEEFSRDVNVYSQGRRTERTTYSWDGTAWEPSNRDTYAYDASGRLTVNIFELAPNGTLEPYTRYTYTYNTNDRVASLLREEYAAGNWENDEITEYTYDASNRSIVEVGKDWDGTAWVNDLRLTFTYNGSSNDYATRLFEDFDGTNWVNSQRRTFTYNAQGHLTQDVLERYVNNAWENWVKDALTLNANGKLAELISYEWTNNAWLEEFRETYTYDASGNNLQESNYTWNAAAWEETMRRYRRYNSYNQVVLDSTLSGSGGTLANSDWKVFYFEEYEDGTSGIATIPTLSSTVSPNPFINNVAIDITVVEAGNHTFEVFNMAGQRIHMENRHLAPGQQTIVWQGQDVPKGVYFYKINSQSGIASGKLMKQ